VIVTQHEQSGPASHSRPAKRARARISWPTLLVLLFDALPLGMAVELARHEGPIALGGAVLCLLFVLLHAYLVLHECVHGAVFADRANNVILGHLLAFVTLCPFLARRRSHALHHEWTGHVELDPTNARARQRLVTLGPRALALLDLSWRAYVPLLALNERIGLWREPFGAGSGAQGAAAERRATYLQLSCYAALLGCLAYFENLAAAASLYAPAFVGLLMMEELVNLPHHSGAPLTRSRLALWEQGRVTHSCAVLPLWSRFVLLNFGLHQAHHRWPGYPWHELPEAHRALAATTPQTVVSNELVWSLRARRRPFISVMSQFIRTEKVTLEMLPESFEQLRHHPRGGER